MTLPRNFSSQAESTADMDVNSLMNNREFQELLQEYFQSSTMTLDEFLENLPRFMMENYGGRVEAEESEDDDEEEEEYYDTNGDDTFMAYLRRSARYSQPQHQLDTSEILFRSLLAGRREHNDHLDRHDHNEIPLRSILPQSPPPSPVPNIVNTAASIPFFQRNSRTAPQVPNRPEQLRRIPSQLRRSTTTFPERFDPNSADDCKSPTAFFDRNNGDLPITNAYMARYGHDRVNFGHNTLIDDIPER